MRTPSDDEPGLTPFATARSGPGHGERPVRSLGALRDRLRSLTKPTAARNYRTEPPAAANGTPPGNGTATQTPLAFEHPGSTGGGAGTGHRLPPQFAAAQPAPSPVGLADPISPPRFTAPEPSAALALPDRGLADPPLGTHDEEPASPRPARRRAHLTLWPSRLRPSPRWARRLILAAWPLGLAAVGIGLYLCYLALSRTQPVGSDGASNALQAWDMLHSNPLLRGWTVTDVSFYTTELPEWAIVEAVRGLNADVLHASAAITYSLVVLVGGLLGRGRATGREGIVRMLIAAGIMVAPQLGPGVYILIFQPDHTGTAVPLMLTWLVLDRGPRSWYVPPIVALMLAWGAIGDQLVLLIGVAPLAVVSAVRAYQILVQRREGWRAGWFDLSLLGAAAAGAEISRIVVKEISAHGGYTVLPIQGGVAAITDMSTHLWLLVQSICGLYGADLFGMTSIGLNGAIALLHLAGLALAGWGLCVVIRRFFSCADRIAQILTVGIGINLVAYLLSTTPQTYWSAREVAPVLAYGAVLAARMLGGRLMKARLVPALSVVLACYLAALGYTVTKPSVPAVSQDLADWLAANHLTYGLSSYGLANTTTLASGETVSLRPVSWENNDAAGGPYEFDKSWYDPRLHDANFVVMTNPVAPLDPIAYWEVKATFGTPQHTYYFGRYIIMTFNTNLLTDLSPSLPPPPSS